MTRLPAVYLRARRVSSTRVDARNLYLGGPHSDRLALVIDVQDAEGTIETLDALTVATHTERTDAPRIVAGWYPDAYVPGLHRGRPAIVQQGFTSPSYDRAGQRHTNPTGLNIHSWEGRSDGCITCPQWWIDAALAVLEAGVSGWTPRRHPDGRPCIGLLLEEA